MTLAQTIGTAIRCRRLSWPGKMTLAMLSQRTGISLSTISNYEHGRATPRLESALRLAHVLGLDLNAIASQVAHAESLNAEPVATYQKAAA